MMALMTLTAAGAAKYVRLKGADESQSWCRWLTHGSTCQRSLGINSAAAGKLTLQMLTRSLTRLLL
jgi:hypothetical protein